VKAISIFIAIFFNCYSFSQELEDNTSDILLTRDFSVGINLNTTGWGATFEYNIQKTYKYRHSLGLIFTNIRHEKEYKISGTSGSKGYYYGKINSLISFRPNYGGNLLLYKSKRENGIEIQYKWKIGISLGLVKPVYLEVEKNINNNFIHFPERYDPNIHYPGTIYSRSNWTRGLGQSKLQTGLFLKNGVDFNFSHSKRAISGGEIGLMVDYFPTNKIEIMYNVENFNFFTALYLQFNLGKKF
jgi:hypothetical protein